MKRASIDKIVILITLIWLLVFCVGNAQNPLKLPTLGFGQQTPSWCWAACMDILFEFHKVNSSVNQCDLAKEYYSLNWGEAPPVSDCSIFDRCNGTCSPGDFACFNYNETLLFNSAQTPGFFQSAHPHFFDLLFSLHAYNSTETTMRISWQKVTQQIDACRPFIITRTDAYTGAAGPHFTVVSGYLEQLDSKDMVLQYLYNVNPLDRTFLSCDAKEEMIPYKLLIAPADASQPEYLFSVRSFAYDIYPITDDCESCTRIKNSQENETPTLMRSPSKEPDLYTLVKENFGKFMGTVAVQYSNKDFQVILKSDSLLEYKIPIKYTLLTNLTKASPNPKFETVTNETDIVDIIYTGVQPNLVSRFHEKNQQWYLEKISLSDVDVGVTCQVGNKTEYLSNTLGQATPSGTPYEQVETYPLMYRFYRFKSKYDGAIYMVPFTDYNNFFTPRINFSTPLQRNRIAKAGTAYQERDVLGALRRKALLYQEAMQSTAKKIKQPLIKKTPLKNR